jgi:hypothetical protein
MGVIRQFLMCSAVMLAIAGSARAQAPSNAPLTFGMNADQASQALGVPLTYVGGRPGDELLVALPNVKGATLSKRSDGLYLQFRRGRLAGWNGDWGTNRP